LGGVYVLDLPRVCVLILTWNTREEVLTCIEHAVVADYANYEVVVIDNASSDGTSAAVREKYPGVTLLENPTNLGYAGGNNRGLRYALEHGADYILIINSDTVMPAGLLKEIVRVASSSETIAVVGVKNLKMSDPSTVWAAYPEVVYGRKLLNVVGWGQPDGPEYGVVKDVEGVSGSCMLLSRRAVEDVGLLDEIFFMYHEDVDWCQRAISKGYRCVYTGTTHILHKGSSSTGMTRAGHYFLARNAIIFARRHGNLLQFLSVVLSTLWYAARREVRYFLGLDKKDEHSLLWRGFRDGLTRAAAPFEELGLR